MKRILSSALLMFACSAAHAEWVEVSKSDDGLNTNYVDPTSVKRVGELVKMWIMSDYKTIHSFDGINYLSTVHQDEFDCKNELGRVLYVAFYSSAMASGYSTKNINQPHSQWKPIAPNSIRKSLLEYACSK